MQRPAERKTAYRKYWKPIAMLALGAVVFVFYFAGVENDQSAMPSESSLTDGAGNIPASEAATAADSLTSSDQNSIRQIESDEGRESTADGQYVLPGLSEEEVRLLHARQQGDLEQMLGDLDAIIIESDSEDGPGITLREMRFLQEQQELELELVSDEEVAIPAGENGSVALTVADLRAFHEEQEKEVKATDFPDEIVIAGSVNGTVDRTRAEIAALHARQRIALESDSVSVSDDPAPVPEVGDQYLTVEQVQELHKSQSRD